MERRFEVSVVVVVNDDHADDPEMEFAAVANAVDQAAYFLRLRSEGMEDDTVLINVREVLDA